jgi:PepSY-associated transmembrane protein
MSQILRRLKKTIIFVHRWLGVCLSLIFLLWFASGIGMMYWDYPGVSTADRMRREQALVADQIKLSPQEAYAKLQIEQPPEGARLNMFDGRPAYRFRIDGAESIVYADNGEIHKDCSFELSRRIVSAWAGEPPLANAKVQTEQDQWTLPGEFKALLPLRKYSWPDGRQAYVSPQTCGVEQYTTRASRRDAYLSAIPHWIYFTPIRKHTEQWSRLVIWASGLGTIAAILGIVIGVWQYSPSKRYRYAHAPTGIPHVGMKRWHTIIGLTFGSLACTWAFSGMLSMEPFPDLQNGDSDVGNYQLAQVLRGRAAPLSAFAAKSPRETLLEIGSQFRAKELVITSVMGEPVYMATAAPEEILIVPVSGVVRTEFDHQAIFAGLRAAARPYEAVEARLVTKYESYYLDRHKALPLPVLFVRFNDPEQSMYYVDPKTAQIVESYNSHSRLNRWLYHGLHSMDFPWLYKYRPAWDVVVLVLLSGGAALCITSLLLSWSVLRRKIKAILSEHTP